MANFRYSTMEVLHAAGMDFGTGAAVPQYKDLSFKVNIPLERGRISVFGLGGDNSIAMLASQDDARFTNTLAVSGIESTADIFDLSFDHEWGLDLQNITNRENIFIQNWDNNKK